MLSTVSRRNEFVECPMTPPNLRLVVNHEPEPVTPCPIPDDNYWAKWAADDAKTMRTAWTVIDMKESAVWKLRYESPEAHTQLCHTLAETANVHRGLAQLAEAALAVLEDTKPASA